MKDIESILYEGWSLKSIMQTLTITELGNELLRKKARQIKVGDIGSEKIQRLIADLRYTVTSKKLGVGLAAPQVGEGVALSVIAIHPTKHRPKVEPYDEVIINPKITQTFGYKTQMWEGCISAGRSGLFAKTLRYKKVEVEYLNQQGKKCKNVFEGLQAQVMQHEIDHLNGVLFVDHVKDTSTYMTMKEYKKMTSKKIDKSG